MDSLPLRLPAIVLVKSEHFDETSRQFVLSSAWPWFLVDVAGTSCVPLFTNFEAMQNFLLERPMGCEVADKSATPSRFTPKRLNRMASSSTQRATRRQKTYWTLELRWCGSAVNWKAPSVGGLFASQLTQDLVDPFQPPLGHPTIAFVAAFVAAPHARRTPRPITPRAAAMNSDEAKEVQQQWGDKPCDHPDLIADPEVDDATGIWRCPQCGAIVDYEEWRRSHYQRPT